MASISGVSGMVSEDSSVGSVSVGLELSRLLSFLDLFKPFPQSQKNNNKSNIEQEQKNQQQQHQSQGALLEINRLGFVGKHFLENAKHHLKKILSLRKIELKETERSITLKDVQTGKNLTNADVVKLVLNVEDELNKPGIFDYDKTMNMVVAGCVSKLKDLVKGHVSQKVLQSLDDIKVNCIQSSGMDFMIQYEVSFMADAAGKTISYPNVDKLGDGHVRFVMDNYQHGRKSEGRARRDVFFWCFDRTCHEISHILQGLVDQKDSHSFSMSAEHDASIGAYSLLWAISKDPNLQEIFPAGFAGEVLFKTMADDYHAQAKWDSKVRGEYKSWVDSFGLKPPSNQICEDNVLVSSFCGKISSDYFTTDEKEVALIFELLFADRTGDVYAKKIEAPSKINRGIAEFLLPKSNEENQRINSSA